MRKPEFTTYDKLIEHLIFSVNDDKQQPITGTYELIKHIWFFVNSDIATFNNKEIKKNMRSLLVNPDMYINPSIKSFIEANVTYSSTQNKIILEEKDFITDLRNWIQVKSENKTLSIPKKRKFNEFLEYLSIKNLPTQKSHKLSENPKTFDELFHNIELVSPSIKILKEIDPPFLDAENNYIGKLKGIICVWVNELQSQGIIANHINRKIIASLLPQKINRFSINESMFGKHQNKAEKYFRTDIKAKVSKLKLSQISQKEYQGK
jgi:hypothetical protein